MKSHGKSHIIQTLLCAISILTICGRSQATEPNTNQWEMHEFMISHWGIPKEEKNLNLFLKDQFNTVIAVPEQFESCQEHGLKALLAAPPEKAVEYVGNPGVCGYFIIDEPSRKGVEFKDLVPRVRAFHTHPGDGELLHVMRQPGFLNNAGWGFTHAVGSEGK